MPKPIIVKPGEVTPVSGIYTPTSGGKQVALSQGDRVPPTHPGGKFQLTTPTVKKGK